MATPVCIQNNILVELPKAFQDELVSDGGLRFYKDTTFRPEWSTTIKGTVASAPIKLTIGDGRVHSFSPERPNIKPIVKKGDKIIFSYLVVMNRTQTDNIGDIFERETPKNPYTTVWRNPNGLELVRIYLQNDNFEVGLFDTKTREWVDRIRGKERDVESFMGKYMPTENNFFNYNNLLPHEGTDYWKVDYLNAIAIQKEDSTFEMIGDYVLIEPLHAPMRVTEQGVIEVYNMEQSKDYKATGQIVSIGEPLKGEPKLNVKVNDIICTDIRYVEKYEIDRHDFWIVRQRYIYGKQPVTNEHK
jgi:co-chaperonin GroES (HSP10)